MSNQLCNCGHVTLGYALDNGILAKRVEASRHQLRQPPAWAIQKEVMDYHEREIRFIDITDIESGKVYSVSIGKFMTYRSLIDRGYGEQYILGLHHWQTKEAEVYQTRMEI